MVAWPLVLCKAFKTVKSLLTKWLTTLYFYLSLFILPPSTPGYTCFYGRIASRVTTYLVHELHPSCVVMPLFILIYGFAISKRSFSNPKLPKTSHTRPGLRFSVDCHIQLPATYMVFSAIMLLPSFTCLFKNHRKIYNMSILMHTYTMMDALYFCLLVLTILLVASLAEPRRTVIWDGHLLYKKVQSTTLGRHIRRLIRLLLLVCINLHTTASAAHQEFTNSLNLRSALKHVQRSTNAIKTNNE